jgi:putative sterol carrier protein
MADSEIAKIFKGLKKKYVGANVKKPTTFYFSLDDDEKWTVSMSPGQCDVKPEKTENADCFFKASKQMFLDVWGGTYTPSAMDFLTGKIKSNNPAMLKDFVAAFKKADG